MRPPTGRPTLLQALVRVLPVLLLSAAAAGAPLRDAGYGDGSLIDARGNYYYPQPDGSYLDTYGTAYTAIEDGLYGDALGNLIDAGPLAVVPGRAAGPAPTMGPAGAASDPQDQAAPQDPGGTTAAPPTDHALGPPDTDPHFGHGHGELGPRYLEDVGDGYLAIDPGELAADPRLSAPPRTDGKPPEPFPDQDLTGPGIPDSPSTMSPPDLHALDPTLFDPHGADHHEAGPENHPRQLWPRE